MIITFDLIEEQVMVSNEQLVVLHSLFQLHEHVHEVLGLTVISNGDQAELEPPSIQN